MEYQRLTSEARDIQSHLDEQTQQTIALDRKLNYARKMLESERKARREAEAEKEQLVSQLNIISITNFYHYFSTGNKTGLFENSFAER